MKKLTLNEKITLEPKITLNEKLTLNEALEDLPDELLPYEDLIEENKYGVAFEEMGKNADEKQTVVVNNGRKFTTDQRNDIDDIIGEQGFDLEFTDDDTGFIMRANDSNTVSKIGSTLDTLDDEKLLSNDREVNYNNTIGVDLQNSLLDYYISHTELNNKMTTEGKEVFKEIAYELGLYEYDNPFIKFVNDSKVRLSNQHLAALNNLYSDGTIKDNNLRGDVTSIINNIGLFRNNNNAKDIVDLVKAYNTEASGNKELFFNNRNEVKNWAEIKGIINNNSTRENTRGWTLSANSTGEDVRKFISDLPNNLKFELRSALH